MKWALLLIIVLTAGLAVPTIANNISDPNMIVYANPDEGWLMDTIWYYYSGQKRPSFRIDSEYGLLMVYLADLSRAVLSKFIKFTPGMFVLVLRWLYLLSWLGALIALWKLVGNHFGRGYPQVLAVALLAVRPSFPYLLNNLKPDPLVLLLMIAGLDHTLSFIKRPYLKHFFAAIAMAGLATVIKYDGPFLLPALVAALYFGRILNGDDNIESSVKSLLYRKNRIAYMLPFFAGAVIVALVFGCIFLYVRASTGLTLYKEYGLWKAFRLNALFSYVSLAGAASMALSAVIFILNNSGRPYLRKVMPVFNELISYSFTVTVAFCAAVAIFGFKWLLNPKYLIMTYVPLGYCAFGMGAITLLPSRGFAGAFLDNIAHKLASFDPVIFFVFLFYIAVEFRYLRNNFKGQPENLFKRATLMSFLVIPLAIIVSFVWMGAHHILPFFAAASVLAIQGIDIFKRGLRRKAISGRAVVFLLSALIVIDIFVNGYGTLKSRLNMFRQKDDIAYEAGKWMKENIPYDAVMVTAPYHYVYIPEEYKNIKVFKGFVKNDYKDFEDFVEKHKPRYIYYNEGPAGGEALPFGSVSEILPGGKVKLIKCFDSSKAGYQRIPGDKLCFYQVLN